MEVRAEQPEDIPAIHQVNLAAFGQDAEADLVDRLRKVTSTLSFVAVVADKVVGHIFFSPVTVAGECPDLTILGLAPLAVLPDYQRQGIGSALVQQGLAECDRRGVKAVVVVGDPVYYSRFGFIPSREKGLSCEYDVPDDAFRVLELATDGLAGCAGTVKYHPEFDQLE